MHTAVSPLCLCKSLSSLSLFFLPLESEADSQDLPETDINTVSKEANYAVCNYGCYSVAFCVPTFALQEAAEWMFRNSI